MEFDWVFAYTTARTILNWSDEEFWAATPRKYFAVSQKYGEMNKLLSPKPKALVGENAIKALAGIAARLG